MKIFLNAVARPETVQADSKLKKTIDINLCQIFGIKTNDLSRFQRKFCLNS